MKIDKSTRHSEIIGDFGEKLVCNWLSRSGFEVTLVDHTGIDIVAYKRGRGRLGITVKSRTRTGDQEDSSVNLFSRRNDDRAKVKNACTVFACKPWIAVYVEAKDHADLYLTSLRHYDRKYRGRGDRAIDDWKMNREHRDG